ncbi:MAG TPA: hypothetical protein VNL18_07930 [Gemmatimonadales bacterium]|nr:hypothetical protein [Gemmatimonadales bacterium]
MKLELLGPAPSSLVLDVESGYPRDQDALTSHLDGEGSTTLDGTSEAAKLCDELLARIRSLDISWASTWHRSG